MKELNQREVEQVSGAFLGQFISDIISIFFKPPAPMGAEVNDNMVNLPYISKEGIGQVKNDNVVNLPYISKEKVL